MEIHFLIMEKSWKSHGKSLLKKGGHPAQNKHAVGSLRNMRWLPLIFVTTATGLWPLYTGQPALAGTPVKNRRSFLEQSFTAHMPLLTAAGAFRLERRQQSFPQWCYLQRLRTI